MPAYIHELKEWPRFRWNEKLVARLLPDVCHRQGRLLGRMEAEIRNRAFVDCLSHAFDGAERILAHVLKKSRFWEERSSIALNSRQKKMVNQLLDGFEGKLTSSKWAKICKVSQDTAARDIEGLVNASILVKNPGGGRSTSYSLIEAIDLRAPARTPSAQR